MKRIFLILAILNLSACAEPVDVEPMYDTAGVERRTLEVAVSSAGIVEPLATAWSRQVTTSKRAA
jgi:hypothetical protein